MELARKNYTPYSTQFYTLSLRLYSTRHSLRRLKDFIRMIYPQLLNTISDHGLLANQDHPIS
jgi:hypothetical protein